MGKTCKNLPPHWTWCTWHWLSGDKREGLQPNLQLKSNCSALSVVTFLGLVCSDISSALFFPLEIHVFVILPFSCAVLAFYVHNFATLCPRAHILFSSAVSVHLLLCPSVYPICIYVLFVSICICVFACDSTCAQVCIFGFTCLIAYSIFWCLPLTF